MSTLNGIIMKNERISAYIFVGKNAIHHKSQHLVNVFRIESPVKKPTTNNKTPLHFRFIQHKFGCSQNKCIESSRKTESIERCHTVQNEFNLLENFGGHFTYISFIFCSSFLMARHSGQRHACIASAFIGLDCEQGGD